MRRVGDIGPWNHGPRICAAASRCCERPGPPSSLHGQTAFLRQVFQRHLWARADMLDDFGSGERAEPAAILMAGAACQSEQETGGEQIASTGGVHKLLDGECGHRNNTILRSDDAALF